MRLGSLLVVLSLGSCALIDAATTSTRAFARRVDYESLNGTALAIVDATGDGRPDVVLAGVGGRLSVLQDGRRKDLVTNLGFVPDVLRVADFDGDGSPDLIGGGGTTLLFVFDVAHTTRRVATHTVEGPLDFDRIFDIAIGDLNADGKNDVALAANTNPRVVFQRSSGGGALVDTSLEIASGATGYYPVSRIGIADRDGDGDDDLILLRSGQNPQAIVSMAQSTPGTFSQPEILVADDGSGAFEVYSELVVADIDGSGREEIIGLRSTQADLVSIHGDGSLERRTLGPFEGSVGHRAVIADVAGDRRSALAVIPSLPSLIFMALIRQRGPLEFGKVEWLELPGQAVAIAAGDLDGDGRDDVAVIGSTFLSVFETAR